MLSGRFGALQSGQALLILLFCLCITHIFFAPFEWKYASQYCEENAKSKSNLLLEQNSMLNLTSLTPTVGADVSQELNSKRLQVDPSIQLDSKQLQRGKPNNVTKNVKNLEQVSRRFCKGVTFLQMRTYLHECLQNVSAREVGTSRSVPENGQLVTMASNYSFPAKEKVAKRPERIARSACKRKKSASAFKSKKMKSTKMKVQDRGRVF